MDNRQMLNLGGGLPPEILQQQQSLNRQQQMAQLLLQQGMQQPQGQMISGRYVAPSIFQQLAPLAQMYAGQSLAKEGDKAAIELANKLREQQQKMGEQYFEALQGKPATYGADVPTETYETVKGSMISPATGPDYRKAFGIATDPYAPSWLKSQAAEMLKPQKVGAEETILQFNPVTGQREIIAQGMPKVSQDIKDIAREAKLDVKNIDNWTSQDWQKVRAIERQINESKRTVVDMGQKDFGNTLKLRGDFRSEPVYKGFQEVESAFGQINKGLDAKSPAGDLAAATKFMKLLDPTSVVRESELAMAMQATGALDKLYNYANLIATGQKLTPNQRDDFRKLSTEFYSTAYDQYNTKRDEYVGIAKRNQLNIDDVVGKEAKAPIKMRSSQDQQALDWANANPNDPRSAQIKQRLGK
jgi:hypothetical protein